MPLDKYGGRRFLLAVGALVISSFMLWFGKIDQQVYGYLCFLTYGAYISGNVFQKKIEAATNVTSPQ
jgi:hypothetical protein